MKIIKSGVAIALVLSASLAAQGAGLGKLTVNSALGQTLDAEIDLVATEPGEAEVMNARVAPVESYRDARIEYSPLLRLLRFSVEKRSNGTSYLKITSVGPINEPFLDALVEVSWPAGKLQREYPILLDPPGYRQAKVAPPTVAAAAPAVAAPQAQPASQTPPAESPAAAPSTPAAPAAGAASEPSAVPADATGTPSAQAEMQQAGGSTAAADTYGPVEKGEYLSKIASQVKPADVSLEQMLVALYRENKDAFSGSNMNRLKTGQILRIPSAEEVSQVTEADARKEIHAQVQDWNAYREQLAGGVASRPAASEPANLASGAIGSAAVSAPPPATSSEPQDRLRISRSENTKGGKASASDRLAAMQEELTAKDNALKESQSRVADLEKQIQQMQRLLDLKGGAASKQPSVAVVPPAPTAAPKEAAKPAEPTTLTQATPEPVKPAEAPKAETPTTEAASPATQAPTSEAPKAEAPKPEAPKTAAAPKPAPKKAAPKKRAPPPPSLVDDLLDNPLYLAGGVGVIALLGIAGFMALRRRRSAGYEGEPSQMSSAFPSDLKPGTTEKPAAGLVDTGNSSFLTDFDKTGPGTIDTDEVDPVAEAEVYIAYGRDAQAEEILKEAMARDKSRHEIALKLLEIYHARKSATAFETVAKELRSAVGESSPLWQKAAAMGAQIDPGNPLYGAAAGATATYTAMSPPAAAPKPNVDFDLESSSSAAQAPAPSFDLDLDTHKPAAGAPAASTVDFDLPGGSHAARMDVPAESQKEEKPAFDFDLSGLDLSSSKPSSAPAPAPAAAGSGGLDLADLSLDSPAAESSGEAVGTKLELAKAYLEIGDKDGARDILNEVAKEGSSAQKEEAKKLIASL
ncbi:MAG TPA: FimV/HubP family polar landmark protein [Usitatibacter sp.]|nr:FimV/HubP family polar landmark protein [Usitatibacter sp.]